MAAQSNNVRYHGDLFDGPFDMSDDEMREQLDVMRQYEAKHHQKLEKVRRLNNRDCLWNLL